jgi:acetylornithine deacetylase/succinyl-diaminopimelate desuccinylase-like protein
MRREAFSFLVLSGVLSVPALAADLKATVESYVLSHEQKIVSELVTLLSIPNVAADRANIREKAELLVRVFARRGFTAEILETEGNPLVYAERKSPGARGTTLYYAHYDGQPVNPSLWKQESPWKPILRDGRMEDGGKEISGLTTLSRYEPNWRIYARSASDDTSPIVALLAAIDALADAKIEPSRNLRVILDGEEEAGSPSLTPAIGRYREKLQADLMLILDGPVHPSNRPTLVFGARGIVTLELTVYGPKFALHSGHYGNWIPNPATRLAQLLASMKDDAGRTVVQGFYEGIEISPEDRRILKAVPDDEPALLKLFGVARPDAVGESLQEALQYPSLNVRGMESAYVGAQARTIIPDRAVAAIDVRLVKETDAEVMAEKVLAHIRRQGYHVVTGEPDDETRARHPKIVQALIRGDGTQGYRTSMDDPQAKALTEALRPTLGEEPVRIRTSGGTVPISPFIEALGFPAVSVPIVNFDNNQHSENENLRLGHFFRGIVTIAATLAAMP